MASSIKNLSDYDPNNVPKINDRDSIFHIIVSDYNFDITNALLKGCYQTLINNGASDTQIKVTHVPGTFELPLAAKWICKKNILKNRFNAVGQPICYNMSIICLGCVIKGETDHDKYINDAVSNALMKLGIKTTIPIIFGVLTPNTYQQALDRAGGKHGNKGIEAAVTAIKMMAEMQHVFFDKGNFGQPTVSIKMVDCI